MAYTWRVPSSRTVSDFRSCLDSDERDGESASSRVPQAVRLNGIASIGLGWLDGDVDSGLVHAGVEPSFDRCFDDS